MVNISARANAMKLLRAVLEERLVADLARINIFFVLLFRVILHIQLLHFLKINFHHIKL